MRFITSDLVLFIIAALLFYCIVIRSSREGFTRGYKAVVWWLLIIAVSFGVILDTLLLVDKRFKDFSVQILEQAEK